MMILAMQAAMIRPRRAKPTPTPACAPPLRLCEECVVHEAIAPAVVPDDGVDIVVGELVPAGMAPEPVGAPGMSIAFNA